MFRQNNNKVLLPIVLFLVLTGIIQTVAQPDVGNSELLDRTFEDFLQGANIDGLVSTLQRLNISFNQISDPAERYTDMAQLNFNLGLLEETKNNTDGALRYFEESRHFAERALDLDPDNAKAWLSLAPYFFSALRPLPAGVSKKV